MFRNKRQNAVKLKVWKYLCYNNWAQF